MCVCVHIGCCVVCQHCGFCWFSVFEQIPFFFLIIIIIFNSLQLFSNSNNTPIIIINKQSHLLVFIDTTHSKHINETRKPQMRLLSNVCFQICVCVFTLNRIHYWNPFCKGNCCSPLKKNGKHTWVLQFSRR